ncbi:MAG: hypothetical protein U1F34_00880 [Gammaproteobacteria bacterium]
MANRSARINIALALAGVLWLPMIVNTGFGGVTARVDLGRIEWVDGHAASVRADLAWDEDDHLKASLQLDELHLDGSNYVHLRLDCGEVQWTAAELACHRGVLRRTGKAEDNSIPNLLGNIELEYTFASGAVSVTANGVAAAANARLELRGRDGQWRGSLHGHDAAIEALRPLAEAFGYWSPQYNEVHGVISFDADFSLRHGEVSDSHAELDCKGLSFNGPAIADNANVHVELKSAIDDGANMLHGQAVLEAGALYYEPGLRIGDYSPGVTLEYSDAPITLNWTMRVDESKTWQLQEVNLTQPGVASFDLHQRRSSGAATSSELELALDIQDLERFNVAHLKAHCAHLPALCGVELAGAASAKLNWDEQGVRNLRLTFNDVHADDDRRRFRIASLNGNVILNDGDEQENSELRWQSAGWQRLDFGGGSVAMTSRAHALQVTQWSDVEILGGMFKVKQLSLANVGKPDFTVTMQGVLTPIPMQAFSQAMGWPIMQGTLSGVIPGLSYRHGRLELDGDLLVRVFGGTVVVRGLSVTSPFGQQTKLNTDIDIRNIDLEQLTGAFSFGKIEGTIEGQVRDIELQNWQPVAFDGYLETPQSDDKPHRISQKAVDNLSAIGGGIGGALSRGFLRIFQDYSYDRLGLHCRLADGICAMQGVAPASDGFYIVTRGGILPPWIDVRGSGAKLPDGRYAVAWSDVLLGFKRINSGQMQLQ